MGKVYNMAEKTFLIFLMIGLVVGGIGAGIWIIDLIYGQAHKAAVIPSEKAFVLVPCGYYDEHDNTHELN